MVPIVAIPLVVREFCSWFKDAFNRKEQRRHFEEWVTAMAVIQNRTVAGVHQALVNGASYEELHHFMTESPWSPEALKKLRLVLRFQNNATHIPDTRDQAEISSNP